MQVEDEFRLRGSAADFRNGGGAAEVAVDDKDVRLRSGYAGFGVSEHVVEAQLPDQVGDMSHGLISVMQSGVEESEQRRGKFDVLQVGPAVPVLQCHSTPRLVPAYDAG